MATANAVSEVVEGVYDITCSDMKDRGRIRAFLFDGEVPTLIDTGLPGSAETLLAGIDTTDVTPDHLLLTHADMDHIGGIDAVAERYNVETYFPKESDPAVEITPDHHYSDGDLIGRFKAIHMPGHCSHQHALVDEERGIAVLADSVVGGDQRGLPAGTFHLPPAADSDDLHRATESLHRLLDYDFSVGLVFHGSSVLDNAREKLEIYAFTA
jgi:hydroxyacylglutathione hydrolase